MAKKTKVKVGDVIPTPISREAIDRSVPCEKDQCMVYEGFMDLAKSQELPVRKVKVTNHGLVFDLNGRRILTVFDTKTCDRIYNYDETYTKTKSRERARASVKPFTARLMVESNQAVPTNPPMSEENRAKLAKWHKEHPPINKRRATKSGRRRISI